MALQGLPALAEGTPPDERWQRIDSPLLNGAGQLAFNGSTSIGVLFGMINTFVENPGIWIQDSDSALLRQVARRGDLAPGTGGRTFRAFESVDLDDSGNLSFIAQLDEFTGSGVWSGPPGDPQLVALAGDPAPGMNDSFGAFLLNGFSIPLQADSSGRLDAGTDAVLFSGRLSDGTNGLWLWQDGVVSLVALEGGPAPGGGQFAILGTPNAPNYFRNERQRRRDLPRRSCPVGAQRLGDALEAPGKR